MLSANFGKKRDLHYNMCHVIKCIIQFHINICFRVGHKLPKFFLSKYHECYIGSQIAKWQYTRIITQLLLPSFLFYWSFVNQNISTTQKFDLILCLSIEFDLYF